MIPVSVERCGTCLLCAPLLYLLSVYLQVLSHCLCLHLCTSFLCTFKFCHIVFVSTFVPPLQVLSQCLCLHLCTSSSSSVTLSLSPPLYLMSVYLQVLSQCLCLHLSQCLCLHLCTSSSSSVTLSLSPLLYLLSVYLQVLSQCLCLHLCTSCLCTFKFCHIVFVSTFVPPVCVPSSSVTLSLFPPLYLLSVYLQVLSHCLCLHLCTSCLCTFKFCHIVFVSTFVPPVCVPSSSVTMSLSPPLYLLSVYLQVLSHCLCFHLCNSCLCTFKFCHIVFFSTFVPPVCVPSSSVTMSLSPPLYLLFVYLQVVSHCLCFHLCTSSSSSVTLSLFPPLYLLFKFCHIVFVSTFVPPVCVPPSSVTLSLFPPLYLLFKFCHNVFVSSFVVSLSLYLQVLSHCLLFLPLYLCLCRATTMFCLHFFPLNPCIH